MSRVPIQTFGFEPLARAPFCCSLWGYRVCDMSNMSKRSYPDTSIDLALLVNAMAQAAIPPSVYTDDFVRF